MTREGEPAEMENEMLRGKDATTVIIAVAAAALIILFAGIAGCARYSNPSMEVDGYEALQEALAGYPEMRFPDLSRYEGVPGFTYEVSRNRTTGNVESDFYLICNYGSGERYGMKGAAASVGVDSDIAQMDFDCRNLRKYDGHYRVAPTVTPTEEHNDVGIECRVAERVIGGDDASERYPEGTKRGNVTLAFIVGDFYYRVSASYGIMPGSTDEEADAVRDAFHDEIRQIAYSVIDQ